MPISHHARSLALLIFVIYFSCTFSSFAAINIVVSSDQSGNVNLGTDPSSTLDLNAGTLTGNVTMGNAGQITTFAGGNLSGTINGTGQIRFNSSTTLGGNIGTSTIVTSITVLSGATLNTSTRSITAGAITINDGGIFSYGSGTITGAVNGASSGVGTFTFNNTKTTAFSIGQSNKLSSINVIDGITVTLGGNISANTINVVGTLKSNGSNINADNINLDSGGRLNINIASAVTGAINGTAAGNGIVQFSGSGTLAWSAALGASNKLAEVDVLDGVNLTITNNINADVIVIGEGASGVLYQNSGTVGADDNSLIKLNTGAIFNYNGGVLNGTVRGTSSNKGTFNVNADYANNFEIGATYDLANLNVATGATLTANEDISANNISIAGTLNLGNTARTITGNLATSGGVATIDLGSANHVVSGNFTMLAGNNLNLTALNNTAAGSVTASGVASVADNINLNITFDPNSGYISNGTSYAIVSGAAGSAINKIDDGNINLNSTSLNQYGLLTFTTRASGDSLVLDVSRASAASITSNHMAQNIYNNIDEVGSKATGNLREFQKYIDNNSTTNSQREEVLKSLVPQVDNSIHQVTFNNAKISLETSVSRLEKLRDKLLLENDIFENHGIWMRVFNSKLSQDSIGEFDGYESTSNGLVLGADQLVEENLRLGVSASYSSSDINSKSAFNKKTNIKNYQFNLYSGYNFEKYFLNSAIGIALNQYSSQRNIPAMALQANADYNGETYIAKIEGGMHQEFDGFELTPKIGLTLARNQISTYSESDAGTLGLTISNNDANLVESEIATNLSYNNFSFSGIKIIPKLNLASTYDFIADKQTANNNFVEQDAQFQTTAAKVDRLGLKYGFGLDIYESSDLVLILNYVVEQKSHYKSNSGVINLRYDFW